MISYKQIFHIFLAFNRSHKDLSVHLYSVQCTLTNEYNDPIWYDVGKEMNTSQVIQGREFMTNFIWQLIQGREFTTNCSFYFFFLPLFHPLNLGCSQSTCLYIGSLTNLHYDPTCTICIFHKEKLLSIQGRKLAHHR